MKTCFITYKFVCFYDVSVISLPSVTINKGIFINTLKLRVMTAKRIKITYQINGTTKVNEHRNQSVVYAVGIMSSSLRSINKDGESVPHARIIGVEAEY